MAFWMDDLEQQRADDARHAENSARLAEAFARFTSTSQGSIEFGERVDFGVTFTEEPYMSYGAYIDLDELDDKLGNEPSSLTPQMPLSSGFVTDCANTGNAQNSSTARRFIRSSKSKTAQPRLRRPLVAM